MFILDPYKPTENYPAHDYTVPLGSAEFRIRLTYRERQDRWYLDIYDADDEPVILGVKLSPGVSILADYELPNAPAGALYLLDLDESGDPCTLDDLGNRCLLVYLEADEVPSAASDDYDVTIEVAP